MLFPNSGSKPLKRLEAMTKRLLTDAFKDRFDTPNFFDISGFILHPKLNISRKKTSRPLHSNFPTSLSYFPDQLEPPSYNLSELKLEC